MVDIMKHMERIGPSGYTLSQSERSGMQVSMLQRVQEEALPGDMLFWGKVFGDKDDYLVCYCTLPASLESGDFPVRKYYYCRSSDNNLVQMPAISADYQKQAAAISGRFVGEPSFPLDEEPEDGGAEEEEGKEPERFREQHRLAYVVQSIDHDAAVTPAGTLRVEPSHQISTNRNFEGLSYEAAGLLSSYYHYRAPETIEAKAKLAKKGLVKGSDFLDPLSGDRPRGVWSTSFDSSNTVAVLKSLLWPGYTFFSTVQRRGGGVGEYGGVYFGNGLRNPDLAFML